mgnify:CR=1 FL=1
MEKRGSLLVISGFSGVGKGTVAKKLVEKYGYSLSILQQQDNQEKVKLMAESIFSRPWMILKI